MWDFWQMFLGILFPPVCVECRQTLQNGLLCAKCRRKLEEVRILQPSAYGCPDIAGICLLFRYEDGIKTALHEVKFHQRKNIMQAMSQEMMIIEAPHSVAELWHLPKDTVVMPVPTDCQRVKQRGYDVPRNLFHDWSLHEGFSWREGLARIRPTSPQYGLNKRERRKNVKDCFAAVMDVKEENVLLVDDIFTTGATVEEAAHILHRRGAKHIWVMAFAGGAD